MDSKIYKERVCEDFNRVRDFFPLLNLLDSPRAENKFIIYGKLIPFDMYRLTSEKNIEDYSIYINATYPIEFPEKNIYAIKDIFLKINWSLIPESHRHKYVSGSLCTHHPNGEINNMPREERSIKILLSTYRLFCQYKLFIETGEWIIDDLMHGVLADIRLISEGYSFADN